MKKRIILGSASPRRKELLSQIGVEFEVMVSEKEERYESTAPDEIVKELALMKAGNVLSEAKGEDLVVIGADTVVVLDGRILGKPRDGEEAKAMLRDLRGREHQVFTGVAVIFREEGEEARTENYSVRTRVFVHAMTEEEIEAYVETGEPLDKAGAYGIQGRFAAYIDRIEGDYYNVVGLPVSRLYQTLKEAGAL